MATEDVMIAVELGGMLGNCNLGKVRAVAVVDDDGTVTGIISYVDVVP